MTVKIDGTNTVANPAFTGADTDTGLQCGTNELKLVTGGAERLEIGDSEVVFNDPSNDVDFRVESNGQTHMLFVDAGNDYVGIRTSSPQASLHVGSVGVLTEPGPTYDVSGDFAGAVINSWNRTSGFNYRAVTDIIAWSDKQASARPSEMRFFTAPDSADATPQERSRITSSGDVLIGTTSTFDAGDTSNPSGLKAFGYINGRLNLASNAESLAIKRHSGNGNVVEFARGGFGNVGAIYVSTSATSYNTSSDYRLKENVVDLDGAITRVKQLLPKRFNFIADADTTVDGFLAHEAQNVVPEAITGIKDEVDGDGNPVYQGIDQSKLVPLLTAALQEAIAKIETLETQNASFEARLTALEGGS